MHEKHEKPARGVAKHGNAYSRKLSASRRNLEAALSRLSVAAAAHDALAEREQVLIDMLLSVEQLMWFQARHSRSATAAQQQPPCLGGGTYIARLLASPEAPRQYAAARALDVDGWSAYVQATFYEVVALLELSSRSDQPGHGACGETPSSQQQQEQQQQQQHVPPCEPGLAGVGDPMQQLQGRIDVFMLRVLFLVACGDAALVGAVASRNHLTCTPAVAPPQHWATVVGRLGLSKAQLSLLNAARHEYLRMWQGCAVSGTTLLHRASVSCSLAAEQQQQLGASGCTGMMPTPQAPAAHGSVASPGTSSMSCTTGSSGRSLSPAASAAAAADAAGDAAAEAQPLELQLARLPRAMVQPGLLLLLFIANTLTPLQLARLLVASFPWGPLAAALAEAAVQLKEQQEHQEQLRTEEQVLHDNGHQPAGSNNNDSNSSAGPARATPPEEQLLCSHVAARLEQLQQQQQAWWARQIGLLDTL